MTVSPVKILSRPRVTKTLMDAMAAYPLVVVAAPLGYGKTTAARELEEALGERVFFITIPSGPHNALYLWDAMMAQLADRGLEIAANMRRSGFPVDEVLRRRTIEQCRADIKPARVIIDDYQNAVDPATSAFVEHLIRERVPDLNIAVFSRVRPNLCLEELRLKGLAAVFDQELLSFRQEEAADYFRLHGCPEAAGEAWSYSEGWPAAMWLSLQSWRAKGTARPARDAEALLGETVYSMYGAGEKALLMQLSLLDGFTADEAARLADDPGAPGRLRELHDKNAFLGHDPATDSYQLHSIFRSFLSRALGASYLDKPALYRRAGECLLARGDLMPAMRFLVRAGRDEDLLRLMDVFLFQGANRLFVFFPGEVMEMVKAIPWPLRLQRPLEYLAYLYFRLVEAGDPTTATLLEEAEERFAGEANLSAALRKRLRGEAMFIRNMLAFNNAWAMRDVHEEAYRLLNGRSAIASRYTHWTFGCPHASYVYLRDPGTYRDMVELVEDNLHYYQELTGGCALGGQEIFRAEWLLERHDFAKVESLLARAAVRAESSGQIDSLLIAVFCRARLLAASGRPDEAVASLEAWVPRVQDAGPVELSNCLDLSLGYLNACLGRSGAIPEWLRRADSGPTRHVVQMLGFIRAVQARAVLLSGDYERLDSLAKGLPVHLGPYDNLFGHLHARVLEAIAERQLRGMDRALEVMRLATDLAKPDHIVLTLAEYGEHILPLVQRLRDDAPGDRYLARLVPATEQYARFAAAEGRKTGRLSSREEEVLRMVARGSQNAEIAGSLGIAVVTVKKILTSAYLKLGAKNRTEAARKYSERVG